MKISIYVGGGWYAEQILGKHEGPLYGVVLTHGSMSPVTVRYDSGKRVFIDTLPDYVNQNALRVGIDSYVRDMTRYHIANSKPGHWQREVPTKDGQYWVATREGLSAGVQAVVYLNGKLVYAGGSCVDNGIPVWQGWWWSEPLEEPAPPKEKW